MLLELKRSLIDRKPLVWLLSFREHWLEVNGSKVLILLYFLLVLETRSTEVISLLMLGWVAARLLGSGLWRMEKFWLWDLFWNDYLVAFGKYDNFSVNLESTDAAPRSPHQSPTWPDAVFDVRLADSPLFFLICADSARFAPFWAKMGRFGWKREPIWPKRPLKHADTAYSGRNGHRNRLILAEIAVETGRNGRRLPFFCFMWPCEREKKKKDGRKIKVCNKRI